MTLHDLQIFIVSIIAVKRLLVIIAYLLVQTRCLLWLYASLLTVGVVFGRHFICLLGGAKLPDPYLLQILLGHLHKAIVTTVLRRPFLHLVCTSTESVLFLLRSRHDPILGASFSFGSTNFWTPLWTTLWAISWAVAWTGGRLIRWTKKDLVQCAEEATRVSTGLLDLVLEILKQALLERLQRPRGLLPATRTT